MTLAERYRHYLGELEKAQAAVYAAQHRLAVTEMLLELVGEDPPEKGSGQTKKSPTGAGLS